MVVHPFFLKLANLRRWNRLFFATIVLLVGATVSVSLYLSEQPPYLAFEQARLALSQARQAEAGRYVPGMLDLAEKQWRHARAAWQRETHKWFVARDYKTAQQLAEVSRTVSLRAAQAAVAVKDSLRWRTAAQLAIVKQKIADFRSQLIDLPITPKDRQKFVAGELLALESELAFHRHEFLLAAEKVQRAAALVGGANEKVAAFLQSYLAELPKWQQMVAETIAWSKEHNSPVIIVDKMGYRCLIYDDGQLQAEYPIELGPNWLGHKRKKGDGATPEGQYRVTKKKERGQSIYHKALEIDYPNERDRQRFRQAQVAGELPQNAHIGGLIEIHGEGGKGVNWTSGCVALTNKNMDAVFKLAKIGTPVTIVGALDGGAVLEKMAAANSDLKNQK
jgi:murein L,D-transpeptidase YafK